MAIRIITDKIKISTQGRTDIVDITGQVQKLVSVTGLREGQITIFATGSTLGVTTIEYEPGLCEKDLPALFDKIAPYGVPYGHDSAWGDDNGASHLRSSLLKTSLTVPFFDGTLAVGTWQQIVVVDFDTRPRARSIIIQAIGE